MARPISKTTKFILALPRTLPAKEVLAKAKASGLKTSESNVHRVRRLHGRGASAPKAATAAATPPAPATKAAHKATPTKKSDFVRSLPSGTPAREVVAKGKAAGIKLDLQYVYKVRSRSKPRRAKAAPAPRPTSASPRPAATSSASTEALLRALGAEIGLGRAVQVLEEERARVGSLTRRLG